MLCHGMLTSNQKANAWQLNSSGLPLYATTGQSDLLESVTSRTCWKAGFLNFSAARWLEEKRDEVFRIQSVSPKRIDLGCSIAFGNLSKLQ